MQVGLAQFMQIDECEWRYKYKLTVHQLDLHTPSNKSHLRASVRHPRVISYLSRNVEQMNVSSRRGSLDSSGRVSFVFLLKLQHGAMEWNETGDSPCSISRNSNWLGGAWLDFSTRKCWWNSPVFGTFTSALGCRAVFQELSEKIGALRRPKRNATGKQINKCERMWI